MLNGSILHYYTLSLLKNNVTSARIPEEDAYYRARNMCVFAPCSKESRDLTKEYLYLIGEETRLVKMKPPIWSFSFT